MRAAVSLILVGTLCTVSLHAQSYADMTSVRKRPTLYSNILTLRAGIRGNIAEDEIKANGQEDEFAIDGSIYYRDEHFSERDVELDAYAGTDGAIISMKEYTPGAGGGRFEVSMRYAQFFREGFYRKSDFIPTGRYEGNDITVYLGMGTEVEGGMILEGGPFFRRYSHDGNSDTVSSFIVPDDFDGFGLRSYFEENTLAIDRATGRPSDGHILSLKIEREWNDSSDSFGTPLFLTQLPSTVWRANLHGEMFIPQSGWGTWVIDGDGQWSDRDDRIFNNEAQKPQGFLWVDGEVGFRFDFGSFSVTPLGMAQWSRSLKEDGRGRSQQLFFGGGVRSRYDMNELFSLYAEYTFLDNESRPPVSPSEDTFGKHQFLAGVEMRFGAVKR